MPTQLAAQLYTLRDFTKTPSGIASTLRRVKEIGYDAVQLSALGPIEADELARMLAGEGLTCCATHVSLDALRDTPQKVIADHALWGCGYTAIGGFGWSDMSADLWSGFVADYNRIAAGFVGSDLSIGYHNHSHELIRYGDTTALRMLIDGLTPDIWIEIDTYWITHGGGDPAAWINAVAGRIPCVHLKDMSIHPAGEQRMAEVGAGNLNFPAILRACRAAGTQWYIIEQDTCYGQDPFACLATSLRNARAMGLD